MAITGQALCQHSRFLGFALREFDELVVSSKWNSA
jgi:hypothetical protein